MKTLFLIGLISWSIQTLTVGLKLTSFNHIKPFLFEDNPSLPVWFKTITWIENLSALSYWASTILIFFSFKSPVFMIVTILIIVGLTALAKYRKNNPVSPITKEEIEKFELGYKGILTAWRNTLEVFIIGALPYLVLLFTIF